MSAAEFDASHVEVYVPSALADLDDDLEPTTIEREQAKLAQLEAQALAVHAALEQADRAGDFDAVITYRLQLEHSLPLVIGQTRLRILRLQRQQHQTLATVHTLTTRETPCP